MDWISKRVKSLFNRNDQESPVFLRSGGVLMEKLISLSNGREHIQIKRFSIEEITKSTNKFKDMAWDCGDYKLFKGDLEGRKVLVLMWEEKIWADHDSVLFGTAISALMSHFKYVLNLISCCLDFEYPALVHEYAGSMTLKHFFGKDPKITYLSWASRIKIARDIAGMLAYLHTSFPMIIVYRNLNLSNVIIDINGDPKLFDFSLAIPIPRGESSVVDRVTGTLGLLDPDYLYSGYVTTKIDVFSFGVILLMLITGKSVFYKSEGTSICLVEFVEEFIDSNGQIHTLVDQRIVQEVKMIELENLLVLARMCTQFRAEDRPEMISVARLLHHIGKETIHNS